MLLPAIYKPAASKPMIRPIHCIHRKVIMPEKFEANNRHYVSILKGGVVSIPANVVKKAQLCPGQLYDVHLIRSRPFMLLFQENPKGAYKLTSQGKYGAAKFTLRSLYNRHLISRLQLPLLNLNPLIW